MKKIRTNSKVGSDPTNIAKTRKIEPELGFILLNVAIVFFPPIVSILMMING